VLRDYDLIACAATLDASRARRFYQDVLGLDFVEDTPFRAHFRCQRKRIQKVAEWKPASYTVLGWRVRDIRTAIESLTGRGVKFEHYEGMAQDELGGRTAPGGSKVVRFKDADGNLAGLTQAVTG
jgi:catechol 2,3-dioxygenase-like lactoylglutathione lyase family enzyme